LLKYLFLFIPLFVISCTSQKTIQDKENIKILNKDENNIIFIIYNDYSKESLIIDKLSSKLLPLNYKLIILPTSQIENYQKYYSNHNKNIIFSLGNSIYKLKSILKLKYNLLIIDSPNKYGNIPNNLKPLKTIIISDLPSMKYSYKIMNNKKYSLYFKKNKYAWLLSNEEIFSLKVRNSKIKFKQINTKIELNKNLNNKLAILFTQNKALLQNCKKECVITSGNYVKSVYVPVNNNFDTPQEYNKLSIKIKKIFKLINQKNYLDSYLFMLENKNKFNLEFFKKIFAFISKPLYKIEPDLKKDKQFKFE